MGEVPKIVDAAGTLVIALALLKIVTNDARHLQEQMEKINEKLDEIIKALSRLHK